MREIKFKAWVVDEYEEDGDTPKTFKMVNWFPEFFSDMSPVTRWGNDFPAPEDPCVILMQYTGLKDSYATEEYFDYIIEEDDGTRRVIEDGNSAVLFKNPRGKYDIKYFWELKPHKVVGNIHENPELLK